MTDIPDQPILMFLAKHQGRWSSHGKGYAMPTVQDAMPPGTSHEAQLEKMTELVAKGLVSGCTCGCRGDWEIKDEGLILINEPRMARRTGAMSDWDDLRAKKRVMDEPPSAVDGMIDMVTGQNQP